MLHVVLYQPEIPPNTGNIIRLCANTGAKLHLIHPLGFSLDEKALRRAGLDYHEWCDLAEYNSLDDFIAQQSTLRLIAFSTHGQQSYADISYCDDDALIFGPETRGLPKDFLGQQPAGQVARIPMLEESRSMNLSNSVAVGVYEAYRQLGFTENSMR